MVFSLAAAILSLSLQGPAGVSAAVAREPAPAWQQIAEGWDELSPPQRDRAMRNYRQYMELPPEKRQNIDQRYEKWKKLPRNDQERFRKKHDQFRGLGLVGE